MGITRTGFLVVHAQPAQCYRVFLPRAAPLRAPASATRATLQVQPGASISQGRVARVEMHVLLCKVRPLILGSHPVEMMAVQTEVIGVLLTAPIHRIVVRMPGGVSTLDEKLMCIKLIL
jgi:hypothetical protein